MTDEFVDDGDKVLYRRRIPTGDDRIAIVEVYLTKNYLVDHDREIIQRYLDNAVAGVLTREGVT